MVKTKKWKSLLLTSVLLFGTVSPIVSSDSARVVYAQQAEGQTLSNVEGQVFKETDVVTVIVKLKEQAVNPELLKTPEGKKQRQEETKPLRRSVLQELETKGITHKKLFEYDLLFNGFALETTYGQAKKIQALARVESVDVTVDYETPQVVQANDILPPVPKGSAIDSNNLIDVQALWDKGVKGQGQVVAVIDSGIDPSHDVLHMTDMMNAKYPSSQSVQAAMQKAGITYGKWYNDKLVYGFNYADWNDELKEKKVESHGMHVAGTAVGNPTQAAPNGDYVAGVAPEAQLLFMRVFSDKAGKGTSSFIYIKAIEDAVKLGADSINMSLGSATGSVLEVGDAVNQAIELARQAGVTVVIAAGNSGIFGNGYAKPYATNPDYGLVSNPSVAYESISVAAINNTAISREVVTVKQLADNATFGYGKGMIKTYATLFDPIIDYQYVYANLGKAEDFNDLEVKGKVALIQRGEITFTEKVKNAKKAGAVGVAVFNHQAGGDEIPSMALDGADKKYPIISMGYTFGEELSRHADTYTLTFDGRNIKQVSDKGNTLTDFTSWGLSSDGELKPDVTAPGGDIYSSYNNGTYGSSNGTSMASPHVAGAVALVKQVLKQRFPDKSETEIQFLVKRLLMSTAKINVNTETKAYTSPRQQGAGVIDATRAALGEVYVTGTNHYGSVSLGNVSDTFSFDVIVHNLSAEEKTLQYTTSVNTDEVEAGRVTLRPRQLMEQMGESTVTVPANGTAKVTISVDTSAYTDELQALMANGYYLEGFVKFSDVATQLEVASIPYVAFKGNFQDLTVLEKPIYDFVGHDKPFYYYQDAQQQVRDPENNVTALLTSKKVEATKKFSILGEMVNDETGEVSFDNTKLAISPNEDAQQDTVVLKAVVLRNYENLKLTVYAKEDTARQNPLYEFGNGQGIKTYFNNGESKKSDIIYETEWNGRDSKGNVLPDGEYQYVVTYRPESSAGQMQETSFLVRIDTVAPQVKDIASQYDSQTRQFKPTIDEMGSGVSKQRLSYATAVTSEDGKVSYETHAIEPNADGSYTIPENVALKDVLFTVVDYASNETSVYLDGSVAKKPDVSDETETQKSSTSETTEMDFEDFDFERGTVTVKLDLNGKSFANPLAVLRYKITDETGQLAKDVLTVGQSSVHTLPYGRYKVEIVLAHEDIRFVSETVQEFVLSPEKSETEVLFKTTEISKNKMTVVFDKLPPTKTKVYAVNNKGEKYALPQSKYNPLVFEKRIPDDDYTIVTELPEGYTTNPAQLTYQVSGKINYLQVGIVEPVYVSEVATEPNRLPIGIVELTTPVLNTTKFVIDELTSGQIVDALQAKLSAIEDVTAYDVSYYDIYLLRNGERVTVDGKRTVTVQNEGKVVKIYHETEQGTLEHIPHTTTDNKVNFTVEGFSHFIMLTEKEVIVPPVDKTALETVVSQVKDVLESEAYQYDTEAKKIAYHEAIKQVLAVLSDDDATQEQIDHALNVLKVAQANLSGRKPQPEKPDESSSNKSETSSTELQTTESQSIETKPVENNPIENSSTENSSIEIKPTESQTSAVTESTNRQVNESSTQQVGSSEESSRLTDSSTPTKGEALPETGEATTSLVVVGVLVTVVGTLLVVTKRRKEA